MRASSQKDDDWMPREKASDDYETMAADFMPVVFASNDRFVGLSAAKT